MNGITQKEKLELEEVFAAIYTKKESKFMQFYREFYSITLLNIKNMRQKIRFMARKESKF